MTEARRLVAEMPLSEIPEGASLRESRQVIVHKDEQGNVRACRNRCRHMGGNMIPVGGSTMRCTKHGWCLDASTMKYENPRGDLRQEELDVEATLDGRVALFERPKAMPWDDGEARKKQAVQAGEFTARYYSHACIEIRCGNKTLFTDPWLTGPAFVRGWWLVHQPPSDWLERIVNADAIYISHEHSDHMNMPTLRAIAAVRPDIPIIVPDFPGGTCARLARSAGMTRVIPTPVGRWIPFGDEARLMIIPDGAGRDDSGLLVEYKGYRLLDTVDCVNPNSGDLPHDVDLLLTLFASGASGFPVCWGEQYDEQRVHALVRRNREQVERSIMGILEQVRPRVWVPFAGYFDEAHPSDAEIRRLNVKNDPVEFCAKVRERFPEIMAVAPTPGTTFDVVTLAREEAPPSPPPVHDFGPWLDEVRRDAMLAPVSSLEGLQQYFEWAGYRSDLVLHVMETNEDFSKVEREFFVDFEGPTVAMQRPSGNRRYLRMKVRSDVFRAVLWRGASWEEISIGFQARFYREPDVYNFDFWMHFSHALPELPPWA